METTLLRRLPPVSAQGAILLSGLGLLSILMGLFAGAALLIPAGASFAIGLVTGSWRLREVRLGRAYPSEGHTTLVAASFVNGALGLYVAFAGFIVLRFGA